MQLLRLRPALSGCCVTYASVRAGDGADVPHDHFVVVPDANRWSRWRLLRMIVAVTRLVFRLRPDIVISTGAAPGYVALRVGRLLGCRTIWVDSLANVDRLSMSGRLAGRHADLWLTQWAHLAAPGGPHCHGTVL